MFAACSRVNAATVSNWLSHFVGQIEEQLNEPASHMLSCRLSASRPWPRHRAVLGKNNSFYRGAVLGLRLIAKKVFIIA